MAKEIFTKFFKENYIQYVVILLIAMGVIAAIYFFPPTFYRTNLSELDTKKSTSKKPESQKKLKPIRVDFKNSMEQEKYRQQKLWHRKQLEDSLQDNNYLEPKINDLNTPKLDIRDF